MNNRQRLIDIIAEHGLDRLTVAEMLKVRRDTVDHWLVSNESKFHEEVPDMAIELLELKLGMERRNDTPSEPGL
jgi:orotate phosphoribosyltransferase-like protein